MKAARQIVTASCRLSGIALDDVFLPRLLTSSPAAPLRCPSIPSPWPVPGVHRLTRASAPFLCLLIPNTGCCARMVAGIWCSRCLRPTVRWPLADRSFVVVRRTTASPHDLHASVSSVPLHPTGTHKKASMSSDEREEVMEVDEDIDDEVLDEVSTETRTRSGVRRKAVRHVC